MLHNARERSEQPVYAAMGGFHLAGRDTEERIQATVDALADINPGLLIPGHCTGWQAQALLATQFKGRCQQLAVGGTFTFCAAQP